MWTGAAARPRPSRPSSAGTCGPSPVCCPAPASAGCAGRDGCPPPPFPWHYWWQAHLLDCLVDAQLRDPRPRRAATIATLTRSVRLRNGGRWTNPFYDDVAWLGLAVQRAGTAGARQPGARRRSSGSCTAAGPRTAGAASGGGAAVARTAGSRTRPRTGPPRSCWPAKARSSSPPRSPTGWPRPSSTPTPASSATACGWAPTARSTRSTAASSPTARACTSARASSWPPATATSAGATARWRSSTP